MIQRGQISFFVVILISLTQFFAVFSNSMLKCTNRGQEFEVGEVFYKCDDGYQTAIACAYMGRKIEADTELIKSGNLHYRCNKDKSGDIPTYQLKFSHCQGADNVAVQLGETKRIGQYEHACEKVNDKIQFRPIRCVVGDKTYPPSFNVNTEIKHESYVYVCSKRIHEGIMQPDLRMIGCIGKLNETVLIGRTVTYGPDENGGKFVYTCRLPEPRYHLHADGCLGQDGKLYKIGSRWTWLSLPAQSIVPWKPDQVIWECQKQENSTYGLRAEPVSCYYPIGSSGIIGCISMSDDRMKMKCNTLKLSDKVFELTRKAAAGVDLKQAVISGKINIERC